MKNIWLNTKTYIFLSCMFLANSWHLILGFFVCLALSLGFVFAVMHVFSSSESSPNSIISLSMQTDDQVARKYAPLSGPEHIVCKTKTGETLFDGYSTGESVRSGETILFIDKETDRCVTLMGATCRIDSAK